MSILTELEKRKSKAYKMYSDGEFPAKIYRETGITKHVLDRYIVKNDLPPQCPEYHEIMMDFVCALYLKEEYSLAQIEKEFGISSKDVKAYIQEKHDIESNQPAELLVQKAYYITAKQYRALKLRAAIGEEKDMSAIVRAALDAYL